MVKQDSSTTSKNKQEPRPSPSLSTDAVVDEYEARLTAFEASITSTLQSFKEKLDSVDPQVENNPTPNDLQGRPSENPSLRDQFVALEAYVKSSLNDFKSQFRNLSKHVESLEDQIDKMEQYSRRNCLVLHGVEEKPNEDVENTVLTILNSKLNLDLACMDLDRCHRLGSVKSAQASNNKTKIRPIIIKFVQYRIRNLAWKRKAALRDSKLLLTESLTAQRYGLLMSARKLLGVKNCWTQDGVIIALHADAKHRINNKTDMEKLVRNHIT